jgi:hypothetical protein
MTTKAEIETFNDWQVTIAENGTVVDAGTLADFDAIEPNVDVAVTGVVDHNLFVYLLQVDPQLNVAVLYSSPNPLAAGAPVTLPPVGGYLKTQIAGSLCAAGCAHQVPDSEWPTLLGGHDGNVKTGTGSEN